MKLSVSAYRAHASAHKKILSSSYQLNYGSTGSASGTHATCADTAQRVLTHLDKSGAIIGEMPEGGDASAVKLLPADPSEAGTIATTSGAAIVGTLSPLSAAGGSSARSTSREEDEEDSSNNPSSAGYKSPSGRRHDSGNKSNQRWMKLRTTVQLTSAIQTIQKKPPLKREDSFLKRFSTRQIPETQETVEDTGSEGNTGDLQKPHRRRRRVQKSPRSVVNPDENFYFYWLMLLTICVLYNLWALIVRQSFPELQNLASNYWFTLDCLSDLAFVLDLVVQLRTGYLEQGLMVYDSKKLAGHYLQSRAFVLDLCALCPLDLLQLKLGPQPLLRFPRFLKVYRAINYYYMVESRTVWPNLWRVVNLIHILLILAHWFGCFYFLLSEAEGFQGDWVYPHRPGDYATLTRKYLGSLYWSTLTLTTIGDLPTPETNAEPSDSADGPKSIPRRGLKSRLLQFRSNQGYVFTIVSYLIGVFIFATIVGQVGNVITNRNANRLEFERLLDGAKTYMRHHKVPGGMKRRVLRWYDYSWSRGRIQGGGDINTALGLLPDKLKTELALHVNLSVLKKVTIFQECQPEFLHDLVLKMKAYIFTPGDSICRKGEVAREMFIIADGILEVISETGRVLTTMKAGDFFGEIGILNLDGLNKRTADVRSVGYSELFSLSREDVLTAMKDYPEAQEILQSLGRKRLMEVRNCARKYGKGAKASTRASHTSVAATGQITGGITPEGAVDESGPKRMVARLRSDVRSGIRSVLRKSRASRHDADSLELRPLHGNNRSGAGKGMLRRMQRVTSDDLSNDENDTKDTGATEEKTISPLGAGLPLLTRLRMLKEKQDREERASKGMVPLLQASPKHHLVKSNISPQESTQEEPREVIGAGLPLLQRLMLLKAKEDKEKLEQKLQQRDKESEKHARFQLHIQPPGHVASSPQTSPMTKSNLKVTSPLSKTSPDQNALPHSSGSISSQSGAKMKVSFKDRIKSLQIGLSQESTKSDSNVDKKAQALSSAMPLKDKLRLLGNFSPKEEGHARSNERRNSTSDLHPELEYSHKPWYKLKKATILTDDLEKPAKVITAKTPRKSSEPSGKILKERLSTIEEPIAIASTITETKKPVILPLKRERKKYLSIDDLSPEYSGLPFVKRLKILNERQKLAELESVIKTRSSSLDNTESSSEASIAADSLIRSQSETAATGLGSVKGNIQPPAVLALCSIKTPYAPLENTMITTSATTTVPTALEIAPVPEQSVVSADIPIDSTTVEILIPDFCNQGPAGDSEDTIERRRLKSILKHLSEGTTGASAIEVQNKDQFHQLLRSQTVEGYAARHSKFVKSVTFNNTLPSPPNSANDAMRTGEIFSLPPNVIDRPVSIDVMESHVSVDFAQGIQASDKTQQQTPALVEVPPPSTKTTFPQQPTWTPAKPKLSLLSAVSNQRKLLRGSLEEQEYFGEVLVGIKQVIQSHLHDVQGKFQERFRGLEQEVRRRDDIISQLQGRIQELERQASGVSQEVEETDEDMQAEEEHDEVDCDIDADGEGGENVSEVSPADHPFMRGDSLDTIFTSSPPPMGTSPPYSSPKPHRSTHRRRHSHSHQQQERNDDFTLTADASGNVTRVYHSSPDTVVVQMSSDSSEGENTEDTDSGSGSDFEFDDDDRTKQDFGGTPSSNDAMIRIPEEDIEEDDDVEAYDYCRTGDERRDREDWEIRMLAHELDRRDALRRRDVSRRSSDESSSGSGSRGVLTRAQSCDERHPQHRGENSRNGASGRRRCSADVTRQRRL